MTESETSVKTYSLADIATHNSNQSSWIVIHNNIYDVTKFLNEVSFTSHNLFHFVFSFLNTRVLSCRLLCCPIENDATNYISIQLIHTCSLRADMWDYVVPVEEKRNKRRKSKSKHQKKSVLRVIVIISLQSMCVQMRDECERLSKLFARASARAMKRNESVHRHCTQVTFDQKTVIVCCLYVLDPTNHPIQFNKPFYIIFFDSVSS